MNYFLCKFVVGPTSSPDKQMEMAALFEPYPTVFAESVSWSVLVYIVPLVLI